MTSGFLALRSFRTGCGRPSLQLSRPGRIYRSGPAPCRLWPPLALAMRRKALDHQLRQEAAPLRLIEISQIWRLLTLSDRHQKAIRAQEIVVMSDDDVLVGYGTDIFLPKRSESRR